MAALGVFLKNKVKNAHVLFPVRHASYSKFANIMEYKKCYKILGIAEDSDQEEIRKAYLNLVKKYHPDSGTKEADAEKFSEIDKAFKVLINKKSRERWDVDETEMVQEQDIKHTAPQHRQYLTYGGLGVGTPFQRQKQYAKIRAIHAAENVLHHRTNKAAAEEGALLVKNPLKHKIKTKYGFDRLVEDLIQESMSRGEFNNLSGKGKPLPSHQNRNPYVDFVTHKLNEVLIDNGFTPEWITLQKEIRNEIQDLRNSLLVERSYFGPCPLSADEHGQWINTVFQYEKTADQINKKISKFNLVVPIIEKQMVTIDLQKEGRKALLEGEHSKGIQKPQEKVSSEEQETLEPMNVFGLIDFLFKK